MGWKIRFTLCPVYGGSLRDPPTPSANLIWRINFKLDKLPVQHHMEYLWLLTLTRILWSCWRFEQGSTGRDFPGRWLPGLGRGRGRPRTSIFGNFWDVRGRWGIDVLRRPGLEFMLFLKFLLKKFSSPTSVHRFLQHCENFSLKRTRLKTLG